MPKRWKRTEIPLSELHTDPDARISEGFVDALVAYMREPTAFERRTVPVRTIKVPAGYESPPEHLAIVRSGFEELRRTKEEHMQAIPVVEGADGSMWAYDDAAYITVFREQAPNANALVVNIGGESDRHRPKGVSTSRR